MSINIISGKWKNTPILISNSNKLKITPSYIKKKLFNWINFDLFNIKCLDLFAGSGSLGLEFASRNCNLVDLNDKNKLCYKNLLFMKKKLLANNIRVFNLDYKNYINNIKFRFYDLIFLDPPYKNLYILINSIKLSLNLIKLNGLIYIETLIDFFVLYNYFSKNLKLLKSDNLKKINFFLFKVI